MVEALTTSSENAEQNYQALSRFMREVRGHLAARGRIMLNFASSGDIAYLRQLIEQAGLHTEVLAAEELAAEHLTVTYYVFRLTA